MYYHRFQYLFFLSGVALLFLLSACQVYHDTTARFNAYFLAKEKMLEVEAALLAAAPQDYNDVLMVLPRIDSASGASQKAELEYVIEKASLPIKLHERSKWVDDCYLLIGKARLYMGDFRNAATTFRYVNTKSPDPDARHTALVWLQRLFIEQNNSKDALYTAEYLSKDENPINNDNARDFYLNMAHYYRLAQDLPRTAAYLEKALPYITNKEMRIKALFIIAQISQKLNKPEKAYQYYSQLTRSNPPYEILFLSQLYTTSAVDMTDAAAVSKADKTLRSLLKDPKNAEYKDRIWFEIGNFESRRGHLPQALKAYQESLAAASQPQQKANTYLQLGKLYYEALQDYAKAALYYDSASQTLPPTASELEAVKNRAAILQEFAEQQAKVKNAERLLQLFVMNEEERRKFLEKEIAAEKTVIDQQQAAMQQSANHTGGGVPPAGNNLLAPVTTAATWYFYNVQAVANGRTAFARTWGNIPLADNWRVSDKVREAQPDEIVRSANQEGKAGRTTSESPPDRYASVKSLESRLAEIPTTEEQVEQLRLQLAEALYQTGKLYFQVLGEPDKAHADLARFLQLAPRHPKVPEVLYTIVRLCNDQANCQAAAYKQQLLEQYPESSYAQLLSKSAENNTDKTTGNTLPIVADEAVSQAYAQAYESYRNGQYAQALEQLRQFEARYPGNALSEQTTMLKILSQLALTPTSLQVENELKNFIAVARQPELVQMAKVVLQKIAERKQP
ncbi:MAG: tetratricopeptide repeat protein [Cytophagales bacterium]|nr:tetratricopeptide repeat protein [Bernardetiaceae bacterium]MDW8204584.1 tetratricopeptide repeat protein [Cytophagales bacterium]